MTSKRINERKIVDENYLSDFWLYRANSSGIHQQLRGGRRFLIQLTTTTIATTRERETGVSFNVNGKIQCTSLKGKWINFSAQRELHLISHRSKNDCLRRQGDDAASMKGKHHQNVCAHDTINQSRNRRVWLRYYQVVQPGPDRPAKCHEDDGQWSQRV